VGTSPNSKNNYINNSNIDMSPKDFPYYETVHDSAASSAQESQLQSPFLVQPFKKIGFNEQARVHYLSTYETEMRVQHKSDIWYMRSDLMTMRKNDRHSLLLALRSIAGNVEERASTIPSLPLPAVESEIPSDFCFRGMEIVLLKREREESRRRAIQAVLSEQRSQRIKENNRKQKGLVILGTPMMLAQQRISDEYRLMTRKAYDEAYLRGLGDAQEARTIFQQSLLFPSVSSRIRQTKRSTPTESTYIDSVQNNGSRVFLGDEQRDAPVVDANSQAALSDILSVKLILQRNSQLKSTGNSRNPVSVCRATKHQSDSSTMEQVRNDSS
jgi:hypothetical protein